MKLNEIDKRTQARREKFFAEKDCPKCSNELEFGYRGWYNVKRCTSCEYEKRGPAVQ